MKGDRIKRVFNSIVFVFFLAGCNDNYPTEKDGEEALKSTLSKQVNIVSFKKIHGKAEKAFSKEYYTLYYEAEIMYPKGMHVQCLSANISDAYLKKSPLCESLKSQVKYIGQKERQRNQIVFIKDNDIWISKDRNFIFGFDIFAQ